MYICVCVLSWSSIVLNLLAILFQVESSLTLVGHKKNTKQKPVENLTMYIIDRFQIHQQMRHQFAFLRNFSDVSSSLPKHKPSPELNKSK